MRGKSGAGSTSRELDPEEMLRINVFLLILDRISTELDKMSKVYKKCPSQVWIWLNLRTQEDNTIKSKCKELVELYKYDFWKNATQMSVQFKYCLMIENSEREGEDENVSKMKRQCFKPLPQLVYNKNLQKIFPNIEIVLRIVLSTQHSCHQQQR